MKAKRIVMALLSSAALMTCASVSASAATVVDFEDGNYSFVSMKTDDGSDNSKLSVVNYNGSKQLKVDVSDCANVPKVKFDVNKMIDGDDFENVRTIEMDVTFETKNGSAVGWAGGSLGTQSGDDGIWSQASWETTEEEKSVVTMTVRKKFLISNEKFKNNVENTHMILSRWSADSDYNMYVDNIKFLDKGGNEIALVIKNDAPAQTTAAVTEPPVTETTVTETEPPVKETEAVTEKETEVKVTEKTEKAEKPKKNEKPSDKKTEDAPKSDDDTDSAVTGNFSAVAAAGIAVISGYAVFMTRKRNAKSKRKYEIT